MSRIDDFNVALQAFTQGVLPTTPIIFAHENGPRPNVDYVVLHTHLTPRIGQPARGAADSNGSQISYITRDVSVTMFAYGISSQDLLSTIALQLDIETSIDALESAGIAIRDIGAINDASIQLDSMFEPRDMMEVRFGITETVTDNPSYIATVAWSGTTQPPS